VQKYSIYKSSKEETLRKQLGLGANLLMLNSFENSVGKLQKDTSFITTPNPWGITVDETNGKIYWASRTQNAIGQANLDGTGVNSSFLAVSDPLGIAVDETNNNLLWTTFSGNSINGMDLSTSLSCNFITSIGGNPHGITIVPAPLTVATCFAAAPALNPGVPTLSQWGLIILALLFMISGTLYLLQPNFQIQQK